MCLARGGEGESVGGEGEDVAGFRVWGRGDGGSDWERRLETGAEDWTIEGRI